jgi:hypothetical protein
MSGLDWLLPGLVIAVLCLQIWQLRKNAGAKGRKQMRNCSKCCSI